MNITDHHTVPDWMLNGIWGDGMKSPVMRIILREA